jgi:hypothetical protein
MSKGKPNGVCKTCDSEIVETVNDSQFGDGECNACEYLRYKTQPALAEALDALLEQTLDQDLACGNELSEKENDLLQKSLSALAKAHGTA